MGLWPAVEAEVGPRSLASLLDDPRLVVRPLVVADTVVGALAVRPRPASGSASGPASGSGSVSPRRPTGHEERLLDDLAAQAALVVAHLDLSGLVSREAASDALAGLTSRERDVLALMAEGLSNTAIAGRLHLSIKTIEPVVSTIFAKLGLHADATSNRRVLAVLAYVRS